MKTNHGGWKKSIFSRHFLQQSIAFFQQLLETKKHETCSTPYPLKSSIIGGILHQENQRKLKLTLYKSLVCTASSRLLRSFLTSFCISMTFTSGYRTKRIYSIRTNVTTSQTT